MSVSASQNLPAIKTNLNEITYAKALRMRINISNKSLNLLKERTREIVTKQTLGAISSMQNSITNL